MPWVVLGSLGFLVFYGCLRHWNWLRDESLGQYPWRLIVNAVLGSSSCSVLCTLKLFGVLAAGCIRLNFPTLDGCFGLSGFRKYFHAAESSSTPEPCRGALNAEPSKAPADPPSSQAAPGVSGCSRLDPLPGNSGRGMGAGFRARGPFRATGVLFGSSCRSWNSES